MTKKLCAVWFAVSTIFLSAQIVSASDVDGWAYALGVSIGFAEFQASRPMQAGYAIMLDNLNRVPKFIDPLAERNIALDISEYNKVMTPLNNTFTSQDRLMRAAYPRIKDMRNAYSTKLRAASPRYGDAFDFGTSIAMAEGQASVQERDATRQAVQTSLDAINRNNLPGLSATELNKTKENINRQEPIEKVYTNIAALRDAYQKDINNLP